MLKYYSSESLAAAVGRSRFTIALLLKRKVIVPDAVLETRKKRKLALFNEGTMKKLKQSI
jgi:hypothetical protein